MIAIIDYGAGNLKSVKKAFDYLKVDCKIISSKQELNNVEKVVLPGVGAFGAAAGSGLDRCGGNDGEERERDENPHHGDRRRL